MDAIRLASSSDIWSLVAGIFFHEYSVLAGSFAWPAVMPIPAVLLNPSGAAIGCL